MTAHKSLEEASRLPHSGEDWRFHSLESVKQVSGLREIRSNCLWEICSLPRKRALNVFEY